MLDIQGLRDLTTLTGKGASGDTNNSDDFSSEFSLEMQTAQLRVMLEVSRKLNSTLDLQELLNMIIEVAKELTNVEAVSILLLHEKTGELRFEAVSGANRAKVMPLVVPLEGSIAGWIVTHSVPQVVNNVREDSRHYNKADRQSQFKTRSILGVPLCVKDRTIGVLEALNKRDNSPFTRHDQEMLEILADQAAVAIDNARLYSEVEHRAEQLTVLHELDRAITASLHLVDVYHAFARHAARLLPYERMAIALKKNKTLQVAYVSGIEKRILPTGTILPLDKSAAGRVVTLSQPLIRHNISHDCRYMEDRELIKSGIQSAMIIPLRIKRQIIGVWHIGSRQIGAYSPEDFAIAQSMADQLAVAIENAQLYENLQDKMRILEETQTRLVHSEKLASIGQLAAGIAHEVNNPLTSVIGFAHLVQRTSVDRQIQSDLKKILSEAQRAAKIVRGLLTFARQNPPERRQVHLNDLLASTLNLLAYELRTHNITWETNMALDLPPLMADPHQLQQVFVNLFNNALQAMHNAHGQGHLTITSEFSISKLIENQVGQRPVFRIIVKDDGPGIPANLLPRIFDPFFTTKPVGEGTGLGMAVCHGIINEHNGSIWAESAPGEGATFFIELPSSVVSNVTEIGQDTTTNIQQPSNDMRVLVVDDEKQILEVLRRCLQNAGYQVDAVTNGEAALTYLDQSEYDLIISDIRMPGLSGPEFFQHLKKQYPALVKRFIFITGDNMNPSTQQFIEEANVPCLGKPFDPSELIECITEL